MKQLTVSIQNINHFYLLFLNSRRKFSLNITKYIFFVRCYMCMRTNYNDETIHLLNYFELGVLKELRSRYLRVL